MTALLSSVSQVKQWLGGSIPSSDDALLQAILKRVSGAALQVMNRDAILATVYTETRNGDGGRVLRLKNTPVLSVSSVTVDGTVIAARTSFAGSGFAFDDDGYLYLAGFCFRCGVQNVVTEYSAGFVEVPDEIAGVVTEAAGLKYKQRVNIGASSKTLAGETVAFTKDDFTPMAMDILSSYRRVYV